MLLGFLLLFVGALGGFFVAYSLGEAYKHNPDAIGGWQLALMAASHGHTSLFGSLHILVGLTMPYCLTSAKTKVFQTIGIIMGAISMSFLMMLRMNQKIPNSVTEDYLGFLISIGLLMSIVALGLQCLGLLKKIFQRI